MAQDALSLSVSSRTLVYGFGQHTDLSEARRLSQASCGETARACKVSRVARNRCVSIAIDEVNIGWGSARGMDAEDAAANALKNCEYYETNKACAVTETRCVLQKKED
jgi:hypothetical protein